MKKKEKVEAKEEKSLKKIKEDKKSEFIKKFKQRWIIIGINTLILIAILIAIFVGINYEVAKWDPTPIDWTISKEYSLTDESKERVKHIEKDINIYFVGWNQISNSSVDYDGRIYDQFDLCKQYNKANSKIHVEIVDTNENLEFAKKYDVKNEEYKIIVECGEKKREIQAYDLISPDSYQKIIYITEQKVTSAIVNVAADKIPKMYFLTGYTSFGLNQQGGLYYFSEALKEEVLKFEELNLLTAQTVPEDCDTLMIMTPEKDFDEVVSNAIIDYIHKGGNILWLNGIYEEEKNFENVGKVLAEYGVNNFESGIIYETDSKKVFPGTKVFFEPDILDSKLLTNVKISAGAYMFLTTKINIDEEKLEELKVTKTGLINSSETSYFTKDLTLNYNTKEDQKGQFLIGAQLEKDVSENENEQNISTLIIYGNDLFISDELIPSGQMASPLIYLANNKDVAFNSIAYLNDNYEEITIRKTYNEANTSFTPTEQELTIIKIIIFSVPAIVILAGIIISIIRKRRK